MITNTFPITSTYCIFIKFNFNKFHKKELKSKVYKELYKILNKNDFNNKIDNNIYFNNSIDITKVHKTISLGLNKSWIKNFIKDLYFFKIIPNSSAIDLLELKKDNKCNII